MNRRLALSAAIIAVVAALAVAFTRSRPLRMVRVGGDTNACACTHRIEP